MKRKIVVILIVCYIAVGALMSLFVVARNMYMNSCREKKFGPSFNEMRAEMDIPLLPNDWRIVEQESKRIKWERTGQGIGHKWKIVVFDRCNIRSELDLFVLEIVPGGTRYSKVVEIATNYSKDINTAEVTYKLQIDEQAKTIKKIQADSLIIPLMKQ